MSHSEPTVAKQSLSLNHPQQDHTENPGLAPGMARLKPYLRTHRAGRSTCPYQPNKRRVHRSLATTRSVCAVPAPTYDSTHTSRRTRLPLEPYTHLRSYH